MKVLSSALNLSFACLLAACTNADQINARSLQSANKSVAYLKERLPMGERIQFEMSYWLLRSQIKDNDEFLRSIDGKTPQQLVDLGKENFAKLKAAGDKEYVRYENWEQMIAQSAAQRSAQDAGDSVDPRDKKSYPRVDYKLHSM